MLQKESINFWTKIKTMSWMLQKESRNFWTKIKTTSWMLQKESRNFWTKIKTMIWMLQKGSRNFWTKIKTMSWMLQNETRNFWHEDQSYEKLFSPPQLLYVCGQQQCYVFTSVLLQSSISKLALNRLDLMWFTVHPTRPSVLLASF
jgi:hypothetical protein